MSTIRSIQKAFNSIAPPQLVGADYATRGGEFWALNGPGGIDYKFSYTGHSSAVKAYSKCAPLTAIINKKAQAYINGKVYIVNKKGKARDKESKSGVAEKITTLRAKPNPFQSEREFDAQQYIYQQLFGYCLVLPIKPVGFTNIDATALWNIPPSMVDIEETRKSFLAAKNNRDVIRSITLRFGEETTTVPVSDVYIIKDFAPSFNSVIFPESRICSLELNINNIIGAYESRNVLINYRGALGIISPDSKDSGGALPMLEKDKEALQDEFLRYGLRNQQWKFIISQAAVKWSQMGVPTRDLMLFEEIEDDIMRICDSYGYPYPLISSAKTNSLGGSNTDPNKRILYQDSIIPESDAIAEQWGNFWGLSEYDLSIIKDFSHVPALQDDEQRKASARKTRNEAYQIEFFNNVCTLNDWRIANGEDPLSNEIGDKYYYELSAGGIQFGKSTFSLSDLTGGQNAPAGSDPQNNSGQQ
jgi:hypothetical protein